MFFFIFIHKKPMTTKLKYTVSYSSDHLFLVLFYTLFVNILNNQVPSKTEASREERV